VPIAGFDDVLHDLYSRLSFGTPLLPWLLWVGAAALLVVRGSWSVVHDGEVGGRWSDDQQNTQHATRNTQQSSRFTFHVSCLAPWIALAAVLALALATRTAQLLPDAAGVWPASSFDEQVYFTNARLLAQGEIPYRDHFLAHPPGIALLLAPGQVGQALWGGPGAFGAARQWMLLISLAGVALTFAVGRKLGGTACGTLAAAVLALDGRAAGVAVLETGVNLWSLAALWLYLHLPDRRSRRAQVGWIALCGACCAAAILTKVPGLAIAGALPLHALIAYGGAKHITRRLRTAAGLLVATGGGVLAGLAPFILLAPDAVLRQMVFFQFLRPQEVRPGIDEALRIAAYPTSLLTTTLAVLGLGVLAWSVIRGPWSVVRDWLVVPIWAVPVLAVFVVGRSYHAPYYVQWAPPLALLAGAICARPLWQAIFAPRHAWQAAPRPPSSTGTPTAANTQHARPRRNAPAHPPHQPELAGNLRPGPRYRLSHRRCARDGHEPTDRPGAQFRSRLRLPGRATTGPGARPGPPGGQRRGHDLLRPGH
jgi:hypothetical protein